MGEGPFKLSDSILNNIASVGEGLFKLSESILNNIASVGEGACQIYAQHNLLYSA